MSDLPSSDSLSRFSSQNAAQRFEVMSGNQDMPDFLKDVPSDFPILKNKDEQFDSAVVSFKSRKAKETDAVYRKLTEQSPKHPSLNVV